MSRHLSKLLFPNTPRDQRRSRMRTLQFMLVACILIAGVVAGMLYLLWQQTKR